MKTDQSRLGVSIFSTFGLLFFTFLPISPVGNNLILTLTIKLILRLLAMRND
ncbi:hypothetical protein Hanom_Chr10g00959871 [Helianthus anomalus]